MTTAELDRLSTSSRVERKCLTELLASKRSLIESFSCRINDSGIINEIGEIRSWKETTSLRIQDTLKITPVFDDASLLIINAIRQMADLFRPIVGRRYILESVTFGNGEALTSSTTDPRDFHE